MFPSSIGPYRIERELGRGGMGEVYLALDTRLDRPVAIKALPAHLAADPDRLARFQREAKVLASLNHPGVGAIYGLEEADGHRYLVLEYIEGETLGERLTNGPVPVEEALSIARQMAEALEAAHEKGVIHRDFKPANVMVTGDGVVKVLDFGLARTAEGAPSSLNHPGAADSPTVSVHSPTIPGAIMGTAGYMSPEQARGKPVDKRSDIFSFGCVLYEMLTGAGPFPGETVTDSLGAILHREPEWSLLPRGTPARVREMLRSCLAKDRRNRLHDIGDARIELERALAGQEWTGPQSESAPTASALKPALLVAGALLMVGAGWLLGGMFGEAPVPLAAQSFHVSASVPAEPALDYIVGISPDARFVVYKARPPMELEGTKPAGLLMVRALDRDEATPVAGTEGIVDAALSPDGRWIAFGAVRDRTGTRVSLKKVALEQGRAVGMPETLCELPTGPGLSLCWSSEREIVVALQWEEKILAVAAAGGAVRTVLDEGKSKEVETWGEIRPGVPGRSIFATRWAVVGGALKERTEVVDLETGKRAPLLQNAGAATMIGEGYIVARRNQNTLMAARVDPVSLKMIGEPETLWSGTQLGTFFVSRSGTLAMMSSPADTSGRRLAWVDEQGKAAPIGAASRAYENIGVSPDGGRVATTEQPKERGELPVDIWIQDLSRRTRSRVPTGGPVLGFVWTADGQRLAYNYIGKDEFTIWSRPADGSGEPVKMYTSPSAQMLVYPAAWSPDAKVLAVLQIDMSTSNTDIVMLQQADSGEGWVAKPYLSSGASEDSIRFSPDAKWVLFVSDESGQRQCYVQRFSGAGAGAEDAKAGRRPVSGVGATGECWWSPDGKEIRYLDNESQAWSVQVQTSPALSVSEPKLLYSIKELKIRSSSFSPDGRLMVVLQADNEQPTKVDLIVNFLDEVRAKLQGNK